MSISSHDDRVPAGNGRRPPLDDDDLPEDDEDFLVGGVLRVQTRAVSRLLGPAEYPAIGQNHARIVQFARTFDDPGLSRAGG